MRVGFGYDVHPLTTGRALILGGIEIPFGKGLAGWSDGDVLTHAIIDALLGAAALGSIGQHFPPGEEKYHNASSITMLEETGGLLDKNTWTIVNIDVTVVAKEPHIMEYADVMRQKLATFLRITPGQINIKASTANGLGFAGTGEGIEAYAVALIDSKVRDIA
jgi:2-C-methyl-D-erythritol 2,4-cyclodiphosphate synthase